MSKLNASPAVITGLAVVAGVLVAALLVFGFVISTLDREAKLKVGIEAQQGVVSDQADSTWKVVKQQAQVQERYAGDFKTAYADIMNARYGGKEAGDPLLNFVMESNPQFDSSLYGQLMTAIEAQRTQLMDKEKTLRDMDATHDAMFETVVTGWILKANGRQRTEIQVITSDRTRDMLQNGENDVNVYGN